MEMSSGLDIIPAEILIYTNHQLLNMALKVLNNLKNKHWIPTQWDEPSSKEMIGKETRKLSRDIPITGSC